MVSPSVGVLSKFALEGAVPGRVPPDPPAEAFPAEEAVVVSIVLMMRSTISTLFAAAAAGGGGGGGGGAGVACMGVAATMAGGAARTGFGAKTTGV